MSPLLEQLQEIKHLLEMRRMVTPKKKKKKEHPAETGIKLDIAAEKGKAPVHDIKRGTPF